MIDEFRRQFAIHESYHALAGWYCGNKLQFMTVTGPIRENLPPEKRTPYYTIMNGHPALAATERPSHADVEHKLMVNLAPGVIDMDAEGRLSYSTALDVLEIMKILAWEDPRTRLLAAEARELLEKYGDDLQAAAQSFFDSHSKDLKKLFGTEQANKAILKLPGELLQGSLSGIQVAQIIEQAWEGPKPEHALPADQHLEVGTDRDDLEKALLAVGRLQQMAKEILEWTRPRNANEESTLEAAKDLFCKSILVLSEMATNLNNSEKRSNA